MKLFRLVAAAVLVAAVSVSYAAMAPASLLPPRKIARSSWAASALTRRTSALATSSTPAPARVLVRLKDSPTPRALSNVAASAESSSGAAKVESHHRLEWRVPRGKTAEQFAADLRATGKVVYAVPCYTRQLAGYVPPAYVPPNDPAFTDTDTWTGTYKGQVYTYTNGLSWWLHDINAPSAWEQGFTGSNVVGKFPLRASGSAFTVAVIDSGIYAHPDNGVDIAASRDFFDHQDANGMLVQDNDATPIDYHLIGGLTTDQQIQEVSHGTCVANEIGAQTGNGIGVAGVGYDAHVVMYKVLGVYRTGQVTIDDGAVVDAIYYAADNGAKVISMSFGGYDDSPAIQDAINYAYGVRSCCGQGQRQQVGRVLPRK